MDKSCPAVVLRNRKKISPVLFLLILFVCLCVCACVCACINNVNCTREFDAKVVD